VCVCVARVMRRARLLQHVKHTLLAFILFSEHALLAFYSTVARLTWRALACCRMLAYFTCFYTLLRAYFTCVLLHCGSSDAARARLPPHVIANLRTWQYTLLKRHAGGPCGWILTLGLACGQSTSDRHLSLNRDKLCLFATTIWGQVGLRDKLCLFATTIWGQVGLRDKLCLFAATDRH
jgi:hypothetical protein